MNSKTNNRNTEKKDKLWTFRVMHFINYHNCSKLIRDVNDTVK